MNLPGISKSTTVQIGLVATMLAASCTGAYVAGRNSIRLDNVEAVNVQQAEEDREFKARMRQSETLIQQNGTQIQLLQQIVRDQHHERD